MTIGRKNVGPFSNHNEGLMFSFEKSAMRLVDILHEPGIFWKYFTKHPTHLMCVFV